MRKTSTIWAGTWQVEMHPWAMLSGSAGSASTSRATADRVDRDRGRRSAIAARQIDVAVAPTDSNRVALIQTKDQGSVWRSDDGGATWRVVNWSRN
jgi:hypothetical protein